MANYEHLSDEQLIRMYREGDKQIIDYIMEKYKNLVRQEANAMYLLGGENDDLIQEGMIGLFKAVQDYNTEKETSFNSFARLCIRRQMYSAIEASKRKKHTPLNTYISLYDSKEEQASLIETMEASEESDPEKLMVSREYAELLESKLVETLSDLEQRVLYLHLLGTDYKTIARLIDKSPKTVDNALQRIKAKTEKILEKETQ
jgi:RNA polymerase sporulation-specific sigma factor